MSELFGSVTPANSPIQPRPRPRDRLERGAGRWGRVPPLRSPTSLTAVPPSRSDIEAEITAADERRLNGDEENRADAAATVLRWLIGDDDHVPVRGKDRGALVGGFGDVVRSREQITDVLALAAEGRQRAAAQGRNIDTGADDRAFARQDADYLDGVMATLSWILGERAESPVTRAHSRELTTRDLKVERVHADDVIEQSRYPWMADRLPPLWYGEGVKFSINWLLGDSTAPPVDPAGRGPYGQDSELPAMLRAAQAKQRALLNVLVGLTASPWMSIRETTMVAHDPRWFLPRDSSLIPSRSQTTACFMVGSSSRAVGAVDEAAAAISVNPLHTGWEQSTRRRFWSAFRACSGS